MKTLKLDKAIKVGRIIRILPEGVIRVSTRPETVIYKHYHRKDVSFELLSIYPNEIPGLCKIAIRRLNLDYEYSSGDLTKDL